MTTRAVIWDLLGFRWAAVVVDGAPTALCMDLPHAPSSLGDVWRGRVSRIEPSMDAAFVDLGAAGSGFLRAKDAAQGVRKPIANCVHEGQWIDVEVTRDADPADGKGVRLAIASTTAGDGPSKPGNGGPALLEKRSDALSRLLRAFPDGALDVVETNSRSAAAEIGGRHGAPEASVVSRAQARDCLDDALDQVLARELRTSDGVTMWFERTRALSVIDIDAGRSGESPLASNLSAAREIPRLLRLKGVGGLSVVDFITLPDRDSRKKVADAVRAAARDDPDFGEIGAMSSRGLLEVTRRGSGPSLADALADDCGRCGSARANRHPAVTGLITLEALTHEALASPGRRARLAASQSVFDAIERWLASATARASDLLGAPPHVFVDPGQAEGAAAIAWDS